MVKKQNIVKKNVVLNKVFYNRMSQVKDKFTQLHPQKRMKQFNNNYWKLVYILQFKLFDQKNAHCLVEGHSKYGAEIKYDNLHRVCGFKKDVFNKLIPFFDQEDVVKAVRNGNNNKSYTSGSQKYSSRATVYYIPLHLLLEMEKEDGVGECLQIETSKDNMFFNRRVEKQESGMLTWVEDAKNSVYGDFKKETAWQKIDMMRVECIQYDENMFLEIAKKNNIDQPEELLKKCVESGKIGNVQIKHGRVFRYGWHRLPKCLREAVLYHGEHVKQIFDFHCCDFKMMVPIMWLLKDRYKLDQGELVKFQKDVQGDFYQLFIEWVKKKYDVVLDRDVVKQGLLKFRNSTNEQKMWKDELKYQKKFFLENYPILTNNMLLKYNQIEKEGITKNCLSVHCQNMEGYIMHELILPRLEDMLDSPFTHYDAIFVKQSDCTQQKRKQVEKIAMDSYRQFNDEIRYKIISFEQKDQKLNFKKFINIINN